MRTVAIVVCVFFAGSLGCAPAAPASHQDLVVAPTAIRINRTLEVAVRQEPQALSPLLLRGGFTTALTVRPFNAYLELVDDRGVGQPYLAEALPQLNTDSWQVLPNGRMETRYRLKAGLRWHDGTPLSAEDFAFGWRVYSTPEMAVGGIASAPLNRIETVAAPDERMIVVRWSRLYPGAGVLQTGQTTPGLPPLPRHVLGEAFQEAQWDALINHSYLTRDFVGLGPYKLDRWEPGSFIEGVGFDGHVLGAPKIDRIRVRFFPDSNAALAAMRAGAVQMASDNSLSFQQGLQLKGEWASTSEGTLLFTVGSYRAGYFQFRPEVVSPRGLLDVRVRKAIALGTDKQQMSAALWGDQGILLDTVFTPNTDFYPSIERAIAKYPYDQRASQRAIEDAGYSRGADGFFTHPTDGHLSFELKTLAGGDNDAERSVMANVLKQGGFDVSEAFLGPAQAQDNQARSTFTGVYTSGTNIAELNVVAQFITAQIPRPETRWTGNNLGGWTNEAYDRLADAFNSTLDPDLRIQQRVEMARLLSEQVPAIPFYYLLGPVPFVASLQGPTMVAPAVTTGAQAWNIHQWEWVR